MSDDFVRVQEGADRLKGWDATRVSVGGLVVYRQRVENPPESVRMEDDGAGTVYVGKAVVGASESESVWQIKKILTSGGNMAILFPEGSAEYGYSWTSRADYVYS